MDYNNLLSAASFSPHHLQFPDAWVGHLPFASWLINEINPTVFVELGTHSGNSYFSFCQTVKEKNLLTKCYAVDTWKGDEHAGFYGEEVFAKVYSYNKKHFGEFSRLLRMSFDEALNYFAEQTIDLLHIDGLHTYEAVKHDFESWLPKLTSNAIVLFHDINVREHDFGVWKFWEETKQSYPLNFEFVHSHGLGVIQLDSDSSAKQLPCLVSESDEQQQLRHYFATLGTRQLERYDLNQLRKIEAEHQKRIGEYDHLLAESDKKTAELNQSIEEHRLIVQDLKNTAMQREEKIADLSQTLVLNNQKVTDLSQTLALSEENISSLNNSIEELTNLKKELLKENEELVSKYHESVRQKRKLLDDFHSTRTWRITQPFRSAVNVIRQFHGKNIRQRQSLSNETADAGSASETDYPKLKSVRSTHNDQMQMQYITDSISKISCVEQTHENHGVTIIIPAYRGTSETEKCILSVLASSNITNYKLLIINDCSPEPEMDGMLQGLHFPQIEILKNTKNLGFVGTVNRGISYAGDSDVILLNSDTLVTNNWVDKLINQAYSNENIGTVTPFSNNATICNYPTLDGWIKLPADESLSQIDLAFSAANFGENIEIPTAVGFCMFIKRKCLNEVGLFDEAAFGKGYGEENDFCRKAIEIGWKNILAADTFVFHEGEVSFSASASEGKANALKILRSRYPDYESEVLSHIQQNPSYQYITAATAARYRLGIKPVILFITHKLEGGTERHVQELSQLLTENDARVLILRPDNENHITLEAFSVNDRLHLNLDASNLKLLAKTLKAFGIEKIHIHHTTGFEFSIEELLRLMQISYDFTVHDYFSICPRTVLIRPTQGYCGVPDRLSECNSCLTMNPQPEHYSGRAEIHLWRLKFNSLLNHAEKVICPSQDTATRIAKIYPSANIIVVPHEKIVPSPYAKFGTPKNRHRFVILGAIGEHKGLSFLENLLHEISLNKVQIEIVLIGYTGRTLKNTENFTQTGKYIDKYIQPLINEQDPDAILFLAQWTETYSYTLSAAIESGRPIIAPNFGAFPERVQGIPNSYIFPWEISEIDLMNYLNSLEFPVNSLTEHKDIKSKVSVNEFYKSEAYWKVKQARKIDFINGSKNFA